MTYQLTHDAVDDLKAIHAYTLSSWGEKQAKSYLLQLQARFALLSKSPTLGSNCPDIDSSTQRFLCEEHMVYYKVIDARVIVYAILHKGMVPGGICWIGVLARVSVPLKWVHSTLTQFYNY